MQCCAEYKAVCPDNIPVCSDFGSQTSSLVLGPHIQRVNIGSFVLAAVNQ